MLDSDVDYVKEFAARNSNVYICDNRIHGVLFKRSLVDIVFLMIQVAQKVEDDNGKHFDYYLLLSGQDYPIKKIEYIEKELRENYPKPYIDCTPYDKNNWVYHKYAVYKKARYYHEWISQNMKRGLLRKALRVTALAWAKMVPLFDENTYSKLTKMKVNLYGGSQWWILPDKIIDYIYAEYKKNGDVVDMLLNECIGPDESFFQTMAMQSHLSDLIELNPVEMREQNCKTFAYFTDEDKEFMGHPYIISVNEFKKLEHSDCWFARKFDMNVDSAILDMIDERIMK